MALNGFYGIAVHLCVRACTRTVTYIRADVTDEKSLEHALCGCEGVIFAATGLSILLLFVTIIIIINSYFTIDVFAVRMRSGLIITVFVVIIIIICFITSKYFLINIFITLQQPVDGPLFAIRDTPFTFLKFFNLKKIMYSNVWMDFVSK